MIDSGDYIRVVGSSNIDSIGYDPEESKLYVRFLGKFGTSTYSYSNVSQDIFDEFLDSSSKGSFLHHRIKGNYKYERVE